MLSQDELAILSKKLDLESILSLLKKEKIVEKNATFADIPFYRPKNPNAPESYSGRIGIHEVLKMTPSIKALVMKGGTSDEIETQAKKEGMMTMFEDGIFKAVQGLTTIEEVLRVITE